ncbi:hypothetical protein VTI74DRAFT_2550 [Chaetomium olivicolor]
MPRITAVEAGEADFNTNFQKVGLRDALIAIRTQLMVPACTCAFPLFVGPSVGGVQLGWFVPHVTLQLLMPLPCAAMVAQQPNMGWAAQIRIWNEPLEPCLGRQRPWPQVQSRRRALARAITIRGFQVVRPELSGSVGSWTPDLHPRCISMTAVSDCRFLCLSRRVSYFRKMRGAELVFQVSSSIPLHPTPREQPNVGLRYPLEP